MQISYDNGNEGIAYIEDGGDGALQHSLAGQHSDFLHLSISDLGMVARASVAPEFRSVGPIVGRSDPLKIADVVVGFDRIDVVDLRQVIRVWDERAGYEPVNENPLWFTAPRSSQAEMKVFIPGPRVSGETRSEDSIKSETADAAMIAHFVEGRKLGDRNRSPFFNNVDIHEAGRPSGDIGSAIKSPSRVPTLGGLAVCTTARRDTQDGGGIQCR